MSKTMSIKRQEVDQELYVSLHDVIAWLAWRQAGEKSRLVDVDAVILKLQTLDV